MVVRSPTRVKFSTKESKEICDFGSIHCAGAEPFAASCEAGPNGESAAACAVAAGAGSDWLGRGCESAEGGREAAVTACDAELLVCPVGPLARQRSICGNIRMEAKV